MKGRGNIKSVEYCRWFRDVITTNGEDILDVTFFVEEAWFHIPGYVNSQNSRVWSATNPHEIKDTPLHEQKVSVWCAPYHEIRYRLHILRWHQHERYCEAILYLLIGHFNGDKLARGYLGHLAITDSRSYTPWLLSVRSNKRRTLQRQSSHSHWICVCPLPSRLKAGTVEPEETAVARQWLGKHVPWATNTHATIELLDEVFSTLSVSYQIRNM
jgi:hypothetical protein